MKNLFAALLLMIGIAVFTNANLTKTAIKVHASSIGNWSKEGNYCPDPGSGCIHLDTVIIIAKK